MKFENLSLKVYSFSKEMYYYGNKCDQKCQWQKCL